MNPQGIRDALRASPAAHIGWVGSWGYLAVDRAKRVHGAIKGLTPASVCGYGKSSGHGVLPPGRGLVTAATALPGQVCPVTLRSGDQAFSSGLRKLKSCYPFLTLE